jgi:hypothetical protein
VLISVVDSGTPAIVDVTLNQICQTSLPDWNQQLADEFRPGLSLALLEQEVSVCCEYKANCVVLD